ncbi:hypothetical protein Bbelb_429890 [Branchiostoma belcheri]|nr:hypothetical protein Bbelb_429890 [Branchiostoma belcheri]
MRKEQRHMLIVLLLILKEVHMPGAQCSSISNGWLKSVDIDDNQIPVLPPSAHDIFSAIRWVLMEKNPWQCDFCGPVALVLIGSIILIIGCKGRTRNPPSGQNPNAVVINTHSTATVMADGDDHYEDIDNHHDETGQDQTKTQSLKAGNQQQTSIEMASGDDHQYEDIDNHHGQTGQGKSQAIYETNTNTTAAPLHSLYTGMGQTLYIGMRSEPNSTRSACAGPGKPVEEKVPAGPPQDEPPLLPPHSKCTSAQPPPHSICTSCTDALMSGKPADAYDNVHVYENNNVD